MLQKITSISLQTLQYGNKCNLAISEPVEAEQESVWQYQQQPRQGHQLIRTLHDWARRGTVSSILFRAENKPKRSIYPCFKSNHLQHSLDLVAPANPMEMIFMELLLRNYELFEQNIIYVLAGYVSICCAHIYRHFYKNVGILSNHF